MRSRSVGCLLSLVILLASMQLTIDAKQQPQERIIHRMPVEQSEPITITDIKVNGRSVSFGEKFVADDGWLKSLVILVKNKSEKRILFASIQLQFPRSAGSKETFSIFEMFHGNWS